MDRREAVRLLVTGLGVGTVAEAMPAEATTPPAWSPRTLQARQLAVGDLIVGPAGECVRVASLTRLSGGRVRVRYTSPYTGETAPQPMNAHTDAAGFGSTHAFAVLARKLPVEAVQLISRPAPPRPAAIDGGQP
jgi:hypothetical protein